MLGVPFLVGRDFGDYITRRNKVLLANEMGLGEYTWIYVTTYHSWLGHEPARLFSTAERPGVYEKRVNLQVREMIERRVADGMPPDLESWEAEIEQLYCPASGELEVVLTVETGAWFDHR